MDPHGQRGAQGTGILWGLGAALAWAAFNTGGVLGREAGFSASDLALLRYGVPAVLMLPLLMAGRGRAALQRLGWRRLLGLAVIVGPLFGVLINTGFGLAPLAHAVVLGPGLTMSVATLLAWRLDGVAPSRIRLFGLGILACGLVVIAADQDSPGVTGGPVWLGDLCFLITGSLWGLFTYLLGRWRVDPVSGTAAIALVSALGLGPYILLGPGIGAHDALAWAEQGLYQGLAGGCLGIICFAAAVRHLGAGPAAVFPATVPALAIMVSVPLLGRWPSPQQGLGVLITTIGLLTALGLLQRWRRR